MFSGKVKNKLVLSTISVVVSFLGIILLLAIKSITLLILFLSFYILTNFAGGIICSQCPFRSKMCPGVLQLYFMSYLSKVVYRNREFSKRALDTSAILVGIFGSAYYLIGFVSLLIFYWNSTFLVVVLILMAFFLTHILLSFSILCPNCTNKENCPMSRVSTALGKNQISRSLSIVSGLSSNLPRISVYQHQ